MFWCTTSNSSPEHQSSQTAPSMCSACPFTSCLRRGGSNSREGSLQAEQPPQYAQVHFIPQEDRFFMTLEFASTLTNISLPHQSSHLCVLLCFCPLDLPAAFTSDAWVSSSTSSLASLSSASSFALPPC